MSWQRHVVLLLCSGKALANGWSLCSVCKIPWDGNSHNPVKEETTEVGAIFFFSASSSFVLLHA